MKKKLIFTACALVVFSAAPSISYASTLYAPPNDLGLVGYWSFDSGDVSGTTVLDQSGNGNNGTTVNSPKQVPGKLAQALSFNGTSQYVSVPYSASLAPPVVSVSAWAYYNSVPGNSDIVVRPYRASGWTSPYVSYNIQGSGGGGWVLWNVAVGGTLHQVPGPVISIHKWYHLVGTYDGTTLRFYVNGALYGTTPASGVIDYTGGNEPTDVGGGGDANNQDFPGIIDDVRIYDRALSASDVKQLYNEGQVVHDSSPTSLVPNGLVGYWTFDGQNTNWTANTTADVSGHGNTGTMVGMSPASSAVLGRFGQALWFSGSNYAYAPDSSSLDPTTAMTVSLWVLWKNIGTRSFFINKGTCGSPSDCQFWMESRGSTAEFVIGAGGNSYGDYVTGGPSIADGKWHLLTGTYDGTIGKLYVDGQIATSFAASGAIDVQTGAALNIGRLSQGLFYTQGSIDDVRIYNRALSATEVKQLYNAGAVGTTIDTAPAQALSGGGLVGYWPFDGSQMNWASNLALDASGNGNNGTLVNMTTANAVMGVIGQALSFNGTSQYVNVGINNMPAINGPQTISLWMRYSSVPTTIQDLFSHWGNNAYSQLSFRSPTDFGLHRGGGGAVVDSSVIPSPGAWHYIVYTYDGTTNRIYVDGVQTGASTNVPDIGATQYADIASWSGGELFNGSIDDVRIYNRALSASEVKQLYNLGR